jgi:hypothetical protein
MNYFAQMLSQNWEILAAVLGVSVLALIFGVFRARKLKAAGEAYLAQHPNAAKVWLNASAGLTQSAIQVVSVNGERPVPFQKGARTGVYLLPGESKLELRYTYTRPGVVYKSVTKYYDGTVTVACEAEKEYRISFDNKSEQFACAEQTGKE